MRPGSEPSELRTTPKTVAAPRPLDTADRQLVDTFGRVADDLRISVTDRCNLRCVYCMPADGMDWLPRSELLSYEEITELAGVFVALGVRTIRITGGEPLLRRDLPELIARLAALEPRPELALTTNGVMLGEQADALAASGLDRVNVSLDSLRRERNLALTRRDDLDRTLAGLEAAKAAGLEPVKVNCVVIRGTNADEVGEFAEFARDNGYIVRFIEYMPLDADGSWSETDVVRAEEMLDSLSEAGFGPTALNSPTRHGSSDPATRYGIGPNETTDSADQGPGGEIGIIASVSAPFCETCNRLRLTADGGFRTCLFALDEINLRDPLRRGAGRRELVEMIRSHVHAKWAGHMIGKEGFRRPDKSMSQLGG